MREFYLVGQSTPNSLRSKFHYDEHGRRTDLVETLVRQGSHPGTWARYTRYRYGLSEQAEQIRVYELRGARKFMITDTRYGYDPAGRMVLTDRTHYQRSTFGQDRDDPALAGTFAELSDFDGARLQPLSFNGNTRLFHLYAEQNLIAVLDPEGNPVQEYLNGSGVNQRLVVKLGRDTTDMYLNHRSGALFHAEADGEIAHLYKQAGTYGEFQEARQEYVHAGNFEDPDGHWQTAGRKYDAGRGLFLSADPLGKQGGETLYSFARGNPISGTDVSGTTPVHLAIVAGMLAVWVGWEIRSWGGGYLTDDPSRETSPTLKIYHAVAGESFCGERGMGHQRAEYNDIGERIWDGFVGATSILGFILPVFHGAGTGLRVYRSALYVDAAANILGAGVETYRGHYVAGPLQMALGAIGGYITRLEGAVAQMDEAVVAFSRHLRRINQGNPNAGVLQSSRQLIQQGPNECAVASAFMLLRTYG